MTEGRETARAREQERDQERQRERESEWAIFLKSTNLSSTGVATFRPNILEITYHPRTCTDAYAETVRVHKVPTTTTGQART